MDVLGKATNSYPYRTGTPYYLGNLIRVPTISVIYQFKFDYLQLIQSILAEAPK